MASSLSGMRVALVHDWLNGMRGGEKCLEVFCELFPRARLFTLLHEKGSTSRGIESMRITTSFLQKLPLRLRRRYPFCLPLFPLAIERFDLAGYDLVLSSSHCVAKGVKPSGNGRHLSYVHAPMRYIWDAFDLYFRRPQTPGSLRLAAGIARPFLRTWDRRSSRRVDTFLCNSGHVRRKIRDLYGREAQVIHPPVDVSRFRPGSGKEDYYLMVGAMAPNKRVDLAIAAFNRLKLPLRIAGSGWDEAYCRGVAGPGIEYLGQVEDSVLVELYQRARAFVFPGVDDFGITPLEAQACGTPVIAFAGGGALETVTERTGIFFRDPSPASLMEAVSRMEASWRDFSPEDLCRNAARFGRDRFRDQIREAVGRVCREG